MDKNGQKYTSNLQMSVFAITDDRKALRSIFRIFILYAGQHSCMYESSCLFSLDSFGKEIKRPSASGNILALEYCGQIFCVPLGLTEKDKAEKFQNGTPKSKKICIKISTKISSPHPQKSRKKIPPSQKSRILKMKTKKMFKRKKGASK